MTHTDIWRAIDKFVQISKQNTQQKTTHHPDRIKR